MKNEIVSVENINSAGIRAQAKKDGLSDVEVLGTNGKTGDRKITVYQFGDVRVADTNGDPIWEESDPSAFAEFLEAEGITI